MEDPNTAHYKISNRGSHIHDASSEQDVQDLWKKNRPTTLKIQQYIEVSSDHRSQSHFKLQSCLTTEYAGVCFWMSEENFPWNPPEQHVVM